MVNPFQNLIAGVKSFPKRYKKRFFSLSTLCTLLKCYSIAGISIIQDVSRGDYPGGFARLLCSEKDRIIIQPMKARSDDDPANEGKINQ